jgi:hypothetical protein
MEDFVGATEELVDKKRTLSNINRESSKTSLPQDEQLH